MHPRLQIQVITLCWCHLWNMGLVLLVPTVYVQVSVLSHYQSHLRLLPPLPDCRQGPAGQATSVHLENEDQRSFKSDTLKSGVKRSRLFYNQRAS